MTCPPLHFTGAGMLPKSCRACAAEAYHLEVWHRDNPGEKKRVKFRCKSWRHEGDCRVFKAKQDLARIGTAIQYHTDWLFLTLTYKRSPAAKYKTWVDCCRHWTRLNKHLTNDFGTIKYIQTWERHADGWPHCHAVMVCPVLYRLCGEDKIRNFKEFV